MSKFKVGDKVIITRLTGGITQFEFVPNMKAEVIEVCGTSTVNQTFVIQGSYHLDISPGDEMFDDELELDREYYRDIKLKQLGICQ